MRFGLCPAFAIVIIFRTIEQTEKPKDDFVSIHLWLVVSDCQIGERYAGIPKGVDDS